MGLIITPQAQIDAYFANDAVSQSTLKDLQGGLDKFLAARRKKEDKNKRHFIFGSAVDTLLTGEEGEFQRQYFTSSLTKKPSDAEVAIIEKVFNTIIANITDNTKEIGSFGEYGDIISKVTEELKWQPTWKPETRLTKMAVIGELYFEELKSSVGKTIIPNETFTLIELAVNSLRQNPRTKKFFDRESFINDKNVDIYYQLPIYFSIDGINCKALLDFFLVVKNSNGEVIYVQPFDIKTKSGYTIDFPTSVKSFRYDIQAAWYTDGLKNPTAKFPKGFPDMKHVVMRPFTFVVDSSTEPGKPLLFQSQHDLLDAGRNGVYNDYTKKFLYRGYNSLLKEFIYHTKNGWVEDKVVAENDGVLSLGFDGITNDYEY